MDYGEGDFQRAFLGFHNSDQLNYAIQGFAVATAYSGLKWFRNNHSEIKLVKELYDQSKSSVEKTEMAKYGRGKRRGYAKRGYKRRRISKRRYGRKGIYRKLKGINRMLFRKGIKSVEIKYDTAQPASFSPGLYGDTKQPQITFTTVSLGNNYTTRNGGKIFIRKIKMHVAMYANTGLTQDQYVRWIVVRDKQPAVAGTAPGLGEIVQVEDGTQDTTIAALMQLGTYRYVNNRNRGRFQWLWSGIIKLNPNQGAGNSTAFLKKTIKVFKPAFYGETDGVTDRGPGQIYLYMYTNSVGFSPLVQVGYRTSWTDN